MSMIIPSPLLAVCADVAASSETHATLDSLFTYAGASGDPPAGSKAAKALEWLRITNKDPKARPLEVLGRIIEGYMEEELTLGIWGQLDTAKFKNRERLERALAQAQLQYVKGGKLIGALGMPSQTLEEFIKGRDVASIESEFNRALTNVDANPREAVSAASNILESICKVYIVEEHLEMPSKQDLKPVWAIVRKDLGFDPAAVEDQDLQRILTGMISVVEGVGALRTHASSAHGAGAKGYKLESRHARLAIHSAHTVALFVLESWEKKRRGARAK